VVTSQDSAVIRRDLEADGMQIGRPFNLILKHRDKPYANAELFEDYLRSVFLPHLMIIRLVKDLREKDALFLMDHCGRWAFVSNPVCTLKKFPKRLFALKKWCRLSRRLKKLTGARKIPSLVQEAAAEFLKLFRFHRADFAFRSFMTEHVLVRRTKRQMKPMGLRRNGTLVSRLVRSSNCLENGSRSRMSLIIGSQMKC
jgi:hypothetical protein